MKQTRERRALRRQAGFTLVELMVTVAIAAILASVAYPSYMDQVRKGRRAEAQAVLMEASQFMERYATMNLAYHQNAAGTAVALPTPLTKAPKEGASKFYDVSLQSVSANAYTLQAVPASAHTGDACGTMTVTNTGVKGAARSDCWRR
jgi:type IV pilus assembly protein PilE